MQHVLGRRDTEEKSRSVVMEAATMTLLIVLIAWKPPKMLSMSFPISMGGVDHKSIEEWNFLILSRLTVALATLQEPIHGKDRQTLEQGSRHAGVP